MRLNFERWAKLNPGYRLEIIDRSGAEELLSDFPLSLDQFTPQALSDVIRMRLLFKTGGAWVDASLFSARPLDDWLHPMIMPNGFFAFEKPGPNRPLSSWFLAATADNAMIREWWQQVRAYWSVARRLTQGIPDDPVEAVTMWPDSFPYYWLHFLFRLLLDRDAEFAAAWAACVKLSAHAPAEMQVRMANDLELGLDEIVRVAQLAPVHKLNWRASYPLEALEAL